MKPKLMIECCRESARLPQYANPGDAGMDVYAAETVVLKPGETKIIPTGLKMAIPQGYEVQVRPRSGISLKTRLRLPNSIGTIDAGYRDEVGVIVHNASISCDPDLVDETLDLNEKNNRPGTYVVQVGDRVAQLVMAPVAEADVELCDSVANIGTNRGGGFGHTGIK